MKLIPFKCPNGHVTIKKFGKQSTPGAVVCAECLKLTGSRVITVDWFGRSEDCIKIDNGGVIKTVQAVRI